MIEPAKLTGALDRPDVRRFFDGTNKGGVTFLIAANATEVLLGEVKAPGARPHTLGQRHQRGCKSLGELGRLTEEVVRQAKRSLPTDAGKTGELGSEVVDRGHQREQATRNREP